MIRRAIILVSYLFVISVSLASQALPDDDRITYEKDIKKIIGEKCFDCHGDDSPTLDEYREDVPGYLAKMTGSRLTTYEEVMIFVKGKDFGSMMRRLDDGENTQDGEPGPMYKYLGDTENERAKTLRIFKQWVGYWNLRTKESIEGAAASRWLQSMLDGDTPADEDTSKEINEILEAITAPRK